MGKPTVQSELITIAEAIARDVLRPNAEAIDRTRTFPRANLDALGKAGLLGLWIPPSAGGAGITSATFVRVMEALGSACASTGMCFLMHSTAAAILGKVATKEQVDRLLRPIVAGNLLVTLAQSERANGSNFFVPGIRAEASGSEYVLDGVKSFVTNGGHADGYLVLTQAAQDPAKMTMFFVEKTRAGVSFQGEWDGMGMAGNSSITLALEGVRVPRENMVGNDGEGGDILFGINATVFILGHAGLFLGIAQRALDIAVEHARGRNHPSAGGPIGNHQIIRYYLAEMYMAIEGARHQIYKSAADQDGQAENALIGLMASKVLANDLAIRVTDKAMQVCGGLGYRKSMPIERLYRDARAGAVMGPASELLRDWIGKSLLGMPLL
jgi:alkylation response protein AidB-like acyl-CoA dehydrogenase